MPVSVRVSPEDAVELVIEQREGALAGSAGSSAGIPGRTLPLALAAFAPDFAGHSFAEPERHTIGAAGETAQI
jgi:hypothetical protein